MNETLLPVDFEDKGMMTDDHIGDIIVKHLPEGVRLTAILDCCHSGTGLDLPFTWSSRGWKEETNPYHCLADVQMLSGCQDDQTSADASTAHGAAGGAMTTAFCDILRSRSNSRISYPELMTGLHQLMRQRGFSQRPQLTASQRFDAELRLFSLDEAAANTNHSIGRTFRRKFPARPRRIQGPLAAMLADDPMGTA